ncbi:hypothetical protein EV360DRAFT_91143 [Lentinula raphanica]|nr:hypothetical protein EV360DRAFT_91143 [Lentinula raphanica]
MFCWATTGVPRVLLDGYTEVSLVHDDDPQYTNLTMEEDDRMRHVNNGICCFKTCTRMMLIPASYLLALLQAPNRDPQVVMDTISSWLLLQILDAIGNYNIV